MVEGFGITISFEVWLVVSIILSIAALVIVGYHSDELDEAVVPVSMVFIIAACAWPITIVIGAVIGVIAIPVWIGKRAKKLKKDREKKKKEKIKFMNDIEKMKKSRN